MNDLIYVELANDQQEYDDANEIIKLGAKLEMLPGKGQQWTDDETRKIINLNYKMFDLKSEAMILFDNLLNWVNKELIDQKLDSILQHYQDEIDMLHRRSPVWYQLFSDYCDELKLLKKQNLKLMNKAEFIKFYLKHQDPNTPEFTFAKAYYTYQKCAPEQYYYYF